MSKQENLKPTSEYSAKILKAALELDRLAKEFSEGWKRIEEETQRMRDEADERIRKQIQMLEGSL